MQNLQSRSRVDLLEVLLLSLSVLVVSGVLLGLLGWYRAWIQVLVSLLAVGRFYRMATRSEPAPPRTPWWVIGLAVPIVASNVYFSGLHLLVDQDPGVYLNTGWRLATSGSLAFDPGMPELGGLPGVSYFGHGHLRLADGRVAPQFLHGLPSLLALGFSIAGLEGLRLVMPLLGALSIYAMFRLFSTWMSVNWAGVAVLMTAYSFAQVYITRNVLSEILGQVLVFGSLWMARRAAASSDTVRWAAAGFIGATLLVVRIDGLLLFLGALAALVVARLTNDRQVDVRALRSVGIGVLFPALVGLADMTILSRGYVLAHAEFLLPLLLATALAGLVYGSLTRFPRTVGWFRPILVAVPWLIGGVLLTLMVWVPRHPVTTDIPLGLVVGAQSNEGLVVDVTRTFAEQSPLWPGWYLGWLLALTGMSAATIALRRRVRGGSGTPSFTLTVLVLLLLVANAINPGITPVQPWASRRLAMFALPGLVGFAVWGLSRISLRARPLGMVLTGAMAVNVVWLALPAYGVRPQDGVVASVDEVCSQIPDGWLVAIVADRLIDDWFLPTVGNACGNPVVGVSAGNLDELDAAWNGPVWVLSDAPRVCVPGGWVETEVRTQDYEPTVTRLPARSYTRQVGMISGPLNRGGWVVISDLSAITSPVDRLEFVLGVDGLPPSGSSVVLSSGDYPEGWWLELRPDGSLDLMTLSASGYRSATVPTGVFADGVARRLRVDHAEDRVELWCEEDLIGSVPAFIIDDVEVGGIFSDQFASVPFDGSISNAEADGFPIPG